MIIQFSKKHAKKPYPAMATYKNLPEQTLCTHVNSSKDTVIPVGDKMIDCRTSSQQINARNIDFFISEYRRHCSGTVVSLVQE